MRTFAAAVIAWARSVAGDQASRRRALFGMTLGACILLFLGAVIIAPFLDRHQWIFILYWLGIAWLTLTIVLVAVYDVLVVLADGRRARQELERRMMEEQKLSTKNRRSNTPPDP